MFFLRKFMTHVSAGKFCFCEGVAGGSNNAKALTRGKLHGERSASGEALIRRGDVIIALHKVSQENYCVSSTR